MTLFTLFVAQFGTWIFKLAVFSCETINALATAIISDCPTVQTGYVTTFFFLLA